MGCIKEADSSDHNATIEQKGFLSQNKQDSTGDPVNVVTGAFTLTEKDINIPSQLLFIAITRHYNNQLHGIEEDAGPFGHGWTHSLNLYLKPGPAPFQVTYVDDKGTCLIFALLPKLISLHTGEFTLDKLKDGTIELYKKKKLMSKFDDRGELLPEFQDSSVYQKIVVGNSFDEILFVEGQSTVATFSISFLNKSFQAPVGALGLELIYGEDNGFLLKQSDGMTAKFRADGKIIQLLRPGIRKDSIVDLNYDKLNRLRKVTGIGSRGIEIEYQGERQLIHSIKDNIGRMWEYEYNKNEELVFVRDPDKRVRRYDYAGWEGKVSIGKGQTELRKIRAMSKVYGYRLENTNEKEWVELTNQYTSDRRVALQKDAFRHLTRFDYNLFTKTTCVTDPNGWTTIYCYDHNGNTTKIRKPNGGTREYIYDNYGNLLAEVDEFCYITRYVELNNLSKLNTQIEYGRRSLGNRSDYLAIDHNEINVGYDTKGNRPLVIDPTGAKTEFLDYSPFGKPKLVHLPDGTTIRYLYDSRSGLPLRTERIPSVSRHNALKKIMQWEYDDYGNVITYKEWAQNKNKDEPLIKIIQSEYDEVGNLAIQKQWIDDNGKGENFAKVDTFKWDEVGRLTEVSSFRKTSLESEAEIVTTSLGYDNLDRELWRITPNGVAHCQHYDAYGHITETYYVHNANDKDLSFLQTENKLEKKEWFFDHGGNEILYVDAIGLKTSRSWTKSNRLMQVKFPTGFTVTYKYDKDDNNIEERSSTGYFIRKEYDKAGRLVNQVDSHQRKITREYDQMSRIKNLTTYSDKDANQTSFEYDQLGRLISVRYGDGSFDEYILNEENEVVKYTRGHHSSSNSVYIEEHSYDSLGRKCDIFSGSLQEMRHVFHIKYEDAIRAISLFDSIGNTKKTLFDSEGNAICQINSDGTRLFSSYDLIGNINRRWSEDQTIFASYGYDYAGRMTTAKGTNTEILWKYDLSGKLISTIQKVGETTTTITYEYNKVGCLSRKYADRDWWINYTYVDGTSFVKEIEIPNHKLRISTDEVGRVIEEAWNNGGKSVYEYNSSGNIRKLSVIGDSGNVIFSQQIDYDLLSRPIKELRSSSAEAFSFEYEYDDFNRLANVFKVNKNKKKPYRGYKYDAWNNRLEEFRDGALYSRYTYDQANRLLELKALDKYSLEYQYDQSGNMVKKGELDISYDHFGRMEHVTERESGKLVRSYSYNALDLLCRTTSDDGEELKVFDQLHEILILKNNKVTQTTYWGFDFDAIVAHSSPSHGLLRTVTDNLGSVIGHGDTVNLSYQDSFGVIDGNHIDQIDFGFCGKRYDSVTDLYINRARYYDPASGRFTQPDPLGYAGDGLNLYAYAKNNPLVYTDLLGLSSSKYSTGQIMQLLEPGHLIEKHVGKSVSELRQRLETEPYIPAATTFNNLNTAVDVVATALQQNERTVANWLSTSGQARLELAVTSNYTVGYGVTRNSSEVVQYSTSVIVLYKSGSMDSGFFVNTGYPKAF